MHPTKNIESRLTRDLVKLAARKAAKNKDKKEYQIVKYFENEEENITEIMELLLDPNPLVIDYSHRRIMNYKKSRIISTTSFHVRVIMHTVLLLIHPRYSELLTEHAFNCIEGRGINSKVKRYSLNHQLKSAIFENKLTHYLQMDIRKCYQSTNGKILRRVLYEIFGRSPFTSKIFQIAICELGLPIGTPPSPIMHHIMMIKADHWIKEVLRVKFYYRYADDIIILSDDKHQLHEWKHRIMNYLFYELDYVIKGTVKIRPLSCNPDIGGYVYHKHERNGQDQHNKGHVTIRKSTKIRAQHNPTERTYFGIMKFADAINLSYKTMNFNDLVDKMRIKRRMDSPEVDIHDIQGVKLSILDYQVKKPDKDKGKYWVKIQVAYRIHKGDKFRSVRVVKGSYEWIIRSLIELDEWIMDKAIAKDCSIDEVRKHILPIDGVYFDYSCGWIIRGTNTELNQIE